MDDECDRREHIGRPNLRPSARLRHTLGAWLAAAGYFAAEIAALLTDTLGILLASAAVVLRTSHWHGRRSGARS
jgi:hypothetical protein